MNSKQLQRTDRPTPQLQQLLLELKKAQQKLLTAESELATEQAAINRFRMHCRLKLDQLVERLQKLRAQKQLYLTRWQLWQQAYEGEETAVGSKPLFEEIDAHFEALDDEKELPLLPTDTPADKAAEKRLYRQLARRFHPDLGDTAVEIAYRTSMMTAVNNAYAAGDIQTLYDLADELEPSAAAELAAIETAKARRLREQILKLRRRRRKARQRLKTLRQESTAQMWHKAQSFEDNSTDWWSLVQAELEQVISEREQEVTQLERRLASLDIDTSIEELLDEEEEESE